MIFGLTACARVHVRLCYILMVPFLQFTPDSCVFQINDPPLCSLTDSLLGCFQVTFPLRPHQPINPSVIQTQIYALHFSPEIDAPCFFLILLESIALKSVVLVTVSSHLYVVFGSAHKR